MDLIAEAHKENQTHFVHVFQDHMALRVQVAEERLRKEMNVGFTEMHKEFGKIQTQFGDVHRQIALQTRWFLAAVGLFATLLTTVNLILK